MLFKEDLDKLRKAVTYGGRPEEVEAFGRIKKLLEEAQKTPSNSDYAKCADEVLSIIRYSRDSNHGRKITECIKRHFA